MFDKDLMCEKDQNTLSAAVNILWEYMGMEITTSSREHRTKVFVTVREEEL